MSNNIHLCGVIRKSQSDWPTLEIHLLSELELLGAKVVSAIARLICYQYATTAEDRGLKCIIAVQAEQPFARYDRIHGDTTVLGAVKSRTLKEWTLCSIVQMPAGVPTATFAVGEAGATNTALFAVSMLAAMECDLLEN